MNKYVHSTFGTQVSRLVQALAVPASLVLMFLTLFSSPLFSQVVPVADYFDSPMGSRGYDTVTNQVDTIWEYINPETNNLYNIDSALSNVIATPQRNPYILVEGQWYNASDVGDHATNGLRGGIHPGSDWNKYLAGVLKPTRGENVYAIANGIVDTIRKAGKESTVDSAGWVIVLKHYLSDGDSIFSLYVHTTTATADSLGTVCSSISDFSISVGEIVTRGQLIAKVGNVKSYTPHLHLEMRLYFNKFGLLWPHGTGGRYPANNAMYADGMTEAQVAYAYKRMRLDSIIDADDFIDAHRPNTFAIEECGGPAITWQNTIGGSIDENYGNIEQTSDGGFILGGSSTSSTSIDKNENNFDVTYPFYNDFWVVKLDANGQVVDQNTIGGTDEDYLYDIHQTSDGGYIAAGVSFSGFNGNKTSLGYGNGDYWIVKLYPDLEIEWQRAYGGSDVDVAKSIQQTSDGGYIVGGRSGSDDTGNKTEESYGADDYWVLKLDTLGNKLWEKAFGGTSYDELECIKEVDGGFLMGGSSSSDANGNKTEGARGGSDYWMVKVSTDGLSIPWQKTFGSTGEDNLYNLSLTLDGGFVACGTSNGPANVDKTYLNNGGNDYWIVKFDASNNYQWQRVYGGIGEELIPNIYSTSDGEYVICGRSSSDVFYDKCEPVIGNDDVWVLKIEGTAGDIIWQKTLGGTLAEDGEPTVTETLDGGYVFGISSLSGATGNKTEPNAGRDYWIVKLGGLGCIPNTEVCNSIDDNCDGLVDEGMSPTVVIDAFAPTTFCQGSSVALAATAVGVTYQWYKTGVAITGATNSFYTATATGTYTCVATNTCGSTTSNAIVVTVNKNPSASISAGGATTFCLGGSVTLTEVPSGGCTYQWYKDASIITGAVSTTYIATTTGNYKCRVIKAATGCFKNSNTIAVSVVCREGESIDGVVVGIYPNPATGNVTVVLPYEMTDASIVISNMLGEKVSAPVPAGIETMIDVSHLPRGSYVLTLQGSGAVHSEIIILE